MDVNETFVPGTESESETNWYDQFLADYDFQRPKTGQLLEGTIIQVREDSLLIDVGLKRDAVVPSKDLALIDKEILENISAGDTVLVSVLQPSNINQGLLVSLNKGIQHKNWDQAEINLLNGNSLELEIIGQNRGGLLVQYHSIRGFLPHSQVPKLRRAKDHLRALALKKEMIGTRQKMKIIEIDRERNRLILSIQAAQEEERRKQLGELMVGQLVQGPVVSIVDFGIFIHLGLFDGLIHISQLDWERIDHLDEVFKIGDMIEAQIIEIDIERERVNLSRKALLPSPWTKFAEQHHVGDFIEGEITKVLKFGAFFKLPTGIEGLIHISEMGYSVSPDPQAVTKPGDIVLVKVLGINPLKERISLSMRKVPVERQIAWMMKNYSEE